MRIYNTLTKKKEEFIPLEEGKVKMYVCGPTVYNFIHIGNARPMIVFDTVRRYMEYKGYEVNYVSNFTDVDDKIIAKAVEEGVSAEEISSRYIKECKKDMADMNVKPATTHPLATQEIDGMIDMIQTLMDKGFAYEVNGTVYFRVKNFKEYGKLSHKNLEDLQSGFRSLQVSGENQKEDPLDFVLWKPKKEGEPFWVSPWSEGRPGWHIECSVMSKKYLGEEIDIHAGGEDLVFPHHENEIAQSECCNGKQFARYWMHNAFLNIDNRKMSKSLGNFFTVREIGEKYDLQVLRFFMLNAHYRSPLNFSAELMEASKNSLERIITCVEQLKHLLETAEKTEMTETEKALEVEVLEYVKKYENSMEDDFNTADAIAAIFELVKFANTKANENSTAAFVQYLFDTIVHLSDVLGLIVNKEAEILDEEIEKLIEERQMARKEKNFARADETDLAPAYQQLEKYQEFLDALKRQGISIPIKHCSNSAAIIRMQDAYFDAVRAGIILYGMYPSNEVEKDKILLKPAMELKSHIAYIKEVEPGVEISYGGTFTTEKVTRVATIPVGYADGYSRGLSNKGSVLIRGKRAKILGKVCMDQFMVDVTEIPEAKELDEVTLLGKDGTDCITMEELGELSGRFNYEFACCISKRVPRVYYKNGQVKE